MNNSVGEHNVLAATESDLMGCVTDAFAAAAAAVAMNVINSF